MLNLPLYLPLIFIVFDFQYVIYVFLFKKQIIIKKIIFLHL
nr:MAG TPA: hypothetical protein [Caudoviricetes sp.]